MTCLIHKKHCPNYNAFYESYFHSRQDLFLWMKKKDQEMYDEKFCL